LARLGITREQLATVALEERKQIGKACHRCRGAKPLTDFRVALDRFDGRHSECKECFNARQRERYAADAKYRENQKNRSRERRTDAAKSIFRERMRERRASLLAAGLTTKGRPRKAKHDAHVHAWRNASKMSEVLHNAHVIEWRSDRSRYWMWRYRNDPAFNAAQRLRAYNRKLKALDGALAAHVAVELKLGRFRFGALTGYTFDELWARLESTMPEGATVDDFLAGSLHIDHIRPRASFDLTDPEQVRACWSLQNLQLLWAEDNQKKAAKHDSVSL
jgi:hypothetical protein